MTITVAEKWESRQHTEGESPSAELSYLIRGTDDDLVALSALRDAAPLIYDGLVRQSYSLDARIAEDTWEGTVRYGRRPPRETGSSTFQFDTGGGTTRITQSLETIARYAPEGKTAPNYQGAIGVAGDTIEGVDIMVPVYNFSETHYIAAAAVTDAYKATLFSITGTVNQSAWRNFAAGEVLFLGASGSKRGEDDWEITFRFAASPNVENLTIGNITGIAKKGWEYLWVLYEDEKDGDAKKLVKRPKAVYVERVYRWGNFAALGIG